MCRAAAVTALPMSAHEGLSSSISAATPPLPAGTVEDDDATRIGPAGSPPTGTGASAASAAPVATAATAAPNPVTSGTQHPRIASETLPGGALAGGLAVQQVGRYQILERLGRGGMATVFRARDPGIGRDVALKFLHASLCEDGEYRARFLQEARSAGGLSHPNIVVVHDVGEIEGRPYMAMELLDGQPLSDEMADGRALPVRRVVVMAIQLARALDYAHSRGIVHRDIKPGNIMRLKGSQSIKVTDFGIAHVDSPGDEQRTRVGDILGTPQYMSPEQAQGQKLDGRSDLFSVGITLYQMLTGQRPFLGDSAVALAVKIAKDDPVPIERLRPEVPAALRRVVERCLAKAPDRRFRSGEELAEALTKVLDELDRGARAQGRPRIVPLRVKWAAMMALIVAAVMALAGTVITQRQHAAMIGQATDTGAALARFIAAQNAVAALSEDWVSVDVALDEIMKTRDFQSVTVVDRSGVVRSASQSALVGKPYAAPVGELLGQRAGSVPVTRYMAGGTTVLGFEAPITYQGKQVGRVALGLPEAPLEQVLRLSILLMLVLVVVTVLAVAVAMYFVANWFAQPIKLVRESMREVAKGRFDHRIREQRKDEFGLLYTAFDQMAQALQERYAGVEPAAQTLPLTPAATPPSSPAGATAAEPAAASGAAASSIPSAAGPAPSPAG